MRKYADGMPCTLEEFNSFSEPNFELISGKLLAVPSGGLASWVAGQVAFKLHPFCNEHEEQYVLIMGPFQCFKNQPGDVRFPDVSVTPRERFPDGKLPWGNSEAVPTLIVESLSPFDTAYYVDSKLAQFFEAGVTCAWVVNPELKTVQIARPTGEGTRLWGDAVISGENAVPGFSCRITEFFRDI